MGIRGSFIEWTFSTGDEDEYTNAIDGRDKIAALLIIPDATNTAFSLSVQASLDKEIVNEREWESSDTYTQDSDRGYQIVMSDPFVYRIYLNSIAGGPVKVVFG